MHFIEFDQCRAIRFAHLLTQENGRITRGPSLARAFEERYEFLQGPRAVQEFDLQKGVTFLEGRFRSLEIEKFQLYHNGMLAEGRADTQALDAFIDDVVEWGAENNINFGPPKADGPKGRGYFSRVIFEMPPLAGKVFDVFNGVGDEVSSIIASGGFPKVRTEVAGVTVNPDPASGATWSFRFERRHGEPLSANKYFSAAPITTKEHFALLERLEKCLTA